MIADEELVQLVVEDLSELDDTGREAALEAAAESEATTTFDLENGPLIRGRLFKVGAAEHLMLLTAHHIVCDGWSFNVIYRELGELYSGVELDEAPEFADYARAKARGKHSEERTRSKDYWLGKHEGVVVESGIPTDRPRPKLTTFKSAVEHTTIGAGLVEALKRTGAKHGATLYATMVAGFETLLHRLSGDARITLSIPAAGQQDAGWEQLVGHCVSFLPLVSERTGGETFADKLRGTGDMMMMYGSTIFIITLTENRVRDPRLWYAPWLFEGQHASMAGLATSGTLTHWFRDTFARDLPRDTAFPTLVEEAAGVPAGAEGLLFLPYFSGERTPIHDPYAKGAFFGLNLTHTRGHMFRAVLEGIAMGTGHVVETYDAVGARPVRVLAVGGGVKNALWLQSTSDVSALPQEICSVTTGASYGDAFLARLAIGQAKVADIRAWNPVERRVTPGPAPALDRAYPLFRQLYEQTKDIARELG